MSRNVVTTELVADEPLVVVLHHEEKLAMYLSTLLSQKQLSVESYSVTDLLNSQAVAQRVASAYKVIWVTSVTSYLQQRELLSEIAKTINQFQSKTTVLVPIFTTFVEQVPGEIPGAQLAFSSQTEAILFLSSELPQAMFIFGQDILDISIDYSSVQIVSQHVQKGLIYAPSIALHPQTVVSFLQRAIRYFLQPQRASVLIRGNSLLANAMAEEVKKLYQSYHFTPVQIQPSLASPTSPVPFSVIENFVTDTISVPLQQFVQTFPSPKASIHAISWQEKPPIKQQEDYGTEVQADAFSSYPEVSDESIETDFPSVVASQLASALAEEPLIPAVIQTPDSKDAAESEVAEVAEEPTIPATLPIRPLQFDLNQEIQKVFSDTHVTHKKTQNKRIEQKKIIVKKKTTKRTALFYGGLAFTGMGLGVLSLAIVFVITSNMFKSSLTSFLNEQVLAQENQEEWDLSALQRIRRLESIVSLQVDTYSAVMSLPALKDAESLVALSSQLPTVIDQNESASKAFKTFYAQVTGLESGDSIQTAEKMTIEALTAREKLATLEKELLGIAPSLSSEDSTESSVAGFSKMVAEKKQSVQILQQLQPLLAKLLGQEKKRTYALILQNNQELRPTGGFIEDVALLTFQNGTLISSRVLSGYQVDKQLSGSVVPPEDISSYLREADWNFVDSNWDPNFPKTAEQVGWFLNKSLATSVDGVITIDLYGIATILEATGPLDLPDYNEVLTDKNIFEQFEFHSEVSLVDNNKDYKQVVFDALIAKLTTLPPEKAESLFSAFKNNFDHQHMLASFVEADELQTMKNLGWSGSLLQPNCPTQLAADFCVVDTVAQVEANVGTNTANHYLKRSIDHSVSLTASAAAHVRTINFENTAQSDAWPKGPYHVFTRLYLPSSAELGSVQVGGVSINKKDIIFRDENSRKVVGFLTEVPIKSAKKIVVSYSVPFTKSSDKFSYTFFEQQQPGSGPTPFTLSLGSPEGYSPTIIAPQAEILNNTITFKKGDVGHGFFGATFEK